MAVPRIIWILLLIDAGLGVAYLGDQIYDPAWWELSYLLDLAGESNLSTWWSTVQLAGAAALLFVIADGLVVRSEPRSWVLWLLPLLVLGMSIDETARIHELIGRASDILLPGGTREATALNRTGIWVLLIGVPASILVAGLLVGARQSLRSAPGSFEKMIVGIAMLLVGAIGVEALSNFADEASTSGVLFVYVEESLEMVGVSIVVWAGVEYLSRNRADRAN